MTDLSHKTFVDAYFDLTGQTTIGATFDGCILELKKDTGRRTRVELCNFIECKLIGDGWPDPIIVVKI